jgi:Ca2+-binding EF-hand superfamily protein
MARTAISVDLPGMDPACESSFVEMFNRIDGNHDGTLNKKEFQQMLQNVPGFEKNPYVFNIIDSDKSGFISLQEFLRFGRAVWAIGTSGNFLDYLRMVFNACDVGKKGALTSHEFFKFMKYIGAPVGVWDRRAVFKAFDENKDGTIDFNEIQSAFEFTLGKS